MNQYISQVPNYMQAIDPNELAKLSPIFQNIGQQQANQQAALAQQNQQVQQAGMVGKQDGSMNGAAMAAMLRKKDENKPAPVYDRSQPMPQYLDPAYMDAGY
jgi:pantothenate kinase-related protein Tda10